MRDLNRAVFSALAAALDPDGASPEAAGIIRQAFVNPAPPPPGKDADAVYYSLQPDPSAPVLTESGSGAGASGFFRFAPYRLDLVFYGPRAEALAWKVYHRIFADGYGQPLRILRAAGVRPVPRPAAPELIREEWEKQHRLRADLTVHLRAAAFEPAAEAPSVSVPPDTVVHLPER